MPFIPRVAAHAKTAVRLRVFQHTLVGTLSLTSPQTIVETISEYFLTFFRHGSSRIFTFELITMQNYVLFGGRRKEFST